MTYWLILKKLWHIRKRRVSALKLRETEGKVNKMATKIQDLFEYRIRRIYGEWYILTNTGDIGPCTWGQVVNEAQKLRAQGYIDGDR